MPHQLSHLWLDNFSLFESRRVFSFYVLVPIIIGLFFAFSQSGSEPLRGMGGHVVYWLLSTLVSWQLLAIGSLIASYFLRPFGASLLVVLITGFVIGILLWVPVSQLRDLLVADFLQEGKNFRGISRYSNLSVTVSNWALGSSLWVGINYFYFWITGMTRFGYQADIYRVKKIRTWLLADDIDLEQDILKTKSNLPSNPVKEVIPPRRMPLLYKRLKAMSTDAILALIAQDHYTRVVLSSGEELVYIRFSDAIQEMAGQTGFQTHRSYWVSLEASDRYWENGHRAFIKLSDNQIIPVSRSFRQVVKQSLASKLANQKG